MFPATLPITVLRKGYGWPVTGSLHAGGGTVDGEGVTELVGLKVDVPLVLTVAVWVTAAVPVPVGVRLGVPVLLGVTLAVGVLLGVPEGVTGSL